jgi:hypothetical protein
MSIASHTPRFVAPISVEQRPLGRRARRIGVGIFFGSVAVNAALGIYAVLAPDFGDTQGKILATSLCVTGAVLLALACEPAWERRLLGFVPPMSAALGAIGFGLTVASIWAEPSSELWGKLVATVFTASVAGVAASLIALARVAPRHGWLVKVTFALLGLAAVLYGVLPWLGDDPSEWYVRGLGVVMIGLAAFAVSVPVVHWLDRGALAVAEATDAIRFCPYCGRSVAGDPGGEVSCDRCGRGFTVTAAGETKANLT